MKVLLRGLGVSCSRIFISFAVLVYPESGVSPEKGEGTIWKSRAERIDEKEREEIMHKAHWKKTFISFYIGQAFSLIGSSAAQFAIIWWITVQTGSAMSLSIAALAGFLPQALLGPFAGVWADRLKRKTVMMAADGFIALCSAGLALAFWVNSTPPVWFVYAVLFLRALGSVFHTPAMQAAIPMLVPQNQLMKAGGWGQFIQSGCFMAGPVLGAALMAVMPLAGVMLLDVAGAVTAVAILAFIRLPELTEEEKSPRTHVLGEMKAGAKVLLANHPLVAVTYSVLLCTLIYVPLGSLYPLMTSEHFQGTAGQASVVEFVFAAGMLVSALIIGAFGAIKRKFFTISMSLVLLGTVFGLSGLLPQGAFWWFVVLCFWMGFVGNFFNVPYMTYIQESIPPESLGRVISLLTSAMSFATPLGLFVAGPVAEKIGIAAWFFWSGLAMVAIGMICWLTTRKFKI